MTSIKMAQRNSEPHLLSGLFALAFMLCGVFCVPVQAQSMYRCGSVYQDRPCEGVQQGKIVGRTGTSPSTATEAAVDGACVKRGIAAQKLVWAREGGATEERAYSDARTGAERQLVADVYHNRGTSSEIRAAIEANCVREKELAAQAGMRYAEPMPEQAATSDAYDNGARDAARARENAMEKTSRDTRKKGDCEYLNRRIEQLTAQQRAGGSASTMEYLNQQRRDANDSLSRSGC